MDFVFYEEQLYLLIDASELKHAPFFLFFCLFVLNYDRYNNKTCIVFKEIVSAW